MPAWPAASFVVVQSEFLLELLVVLCHPPAQLGELNQAPQRDPLGQVGAPIFGRGFHVCGPFEQQPDRLQLGLAVSMAMRRLDPAGGEATALRTLGAWAPGDGVPRLGRQRCRQVAHGPGLTAIVRPARPASTGWPPRVPPLGRLVPIGVNLRIALAHGTAVAMEA